MQKNAAHTYAISSLLVLSLTGCAWIPSTPLVQGATSAQPVPGPTPVANGSIFQSAQPINYGYQPLFEDRRPRDAPRDKCAHFREINGTAAAFQYLQKNYNPIASSFL